jgi:hypothetical protein
MPEGWSLPKVTGRAPPIDLTIDGRILLFQASPRAASMTISTGLIDPRYNALLGNPYRGPGPPANIHYLKPAGTLSTGRRPDGRRFPRTTQNLYGRVSVVDYYIAWPYQCALGPDAPCPAVLALRVLHVQVDWSKLARPATDDGGDSRGHDLGDSDPCRRQTVTCRAIRRRGDVRVAGHLHLGCRSTPATTVRPMRRPVGDPLT